MSRLDHGVLNVPLAKRGNIDAQIDRYKADRARELKAESLGRWAAVQEQRNSIRKILGLLSDDRVMALAKVLGSRKPSTARKALYQAACHNLPVWIACLEREVA